MHLKYAHVFLFEGYLRFVAPHRLKSQALGRPVVMLPVIMIPVVTAANSGISLTLGAYE